MRSFSLLIIFLLIISPNSWSQQNDYQSYYEKGKTQIKNKDYSDARQSLIIAMTDEASNPYRIPAHYLYALAAYKGGDIKTAYEQAEKLVAKSKESSISADKKSEILYLAATTAFESDQSLQAMMWLEAIKGSKLRSASLKLKRTFLPKKSLAELLLLYKRYEKDRVLSETIADKIASKQELNEEDKLFLKSIENNFGYTSPYLKKKPNLAQPIIAKKKDTYNVAVMFPFKLQGSENARDAQLFLDMYEGMQIAQKDLEAEGVKINLLPYDTEQDTEKVRKLVGMESFKAIDLFVGPLYPTTFPIIAEFAQENSINVLNPLSSNIDIIKEKDNFYLFEPSYQTQAKEVAAYAMDSIRTQNAYILYGESRADSVLAHAYKQKVEEKGGTVKVFKQIPVNKSTFRSIKSALEPIAPKPKKPRQGEVFKIPDSDTTSHIFVASSELAVAGTVISTLKTALVDIPLFVNKSWLEFEQLDMNDFMERSVYFVYTDYVSSLKNEEFVRQYIQKTNLLPSDYAYIGYESMYLFGQIMGKYGVSFQEALHRENFVEGKVMIGHNYFEANDNQFVPILRFTDNRLEIVNSFYKE